VIKIDHDLYLRFLTPFCVWVWPQGCIEQVTGVGDKGEDAIIEQEERLRSMSAAEIDEEMNAFKACFAWIRSM
jgi:hypothetical protein